ncbi:hypothetical protein AAEU28_15570 [Pseudoalteromonas sp. SS15]|uniref:hypothetical protein n=1 Tax=Pseudoalteromonas sp. SS15 TaxID=3139393 RepID=UPI003BA9C8FE
MDRLDKFQKSFAEALEKTQENNDHKQQLLRLENDYKINVAYNLCIQLNAIEPPLSSDILEQQSALENLQTSLLKEANDKIDSYKVELEKYEQAVLNNDLLWDLLLTHLLLFKRYSRLNSTNQFYSKFNTDNKFFEFANALVINLEDQEIEKLNDKKDVMISSLKMVLSSFKKLKNNTIWLTSKDVEDCQWCYSYIEQYLSDTNRKHIAYCFKVINKNYGVEHPNDTESLYKYCCLFLMTLPQIASQDTYENFIRKIKAAFSSRKHRTKNKEKTARNFMLDNDVINKLKELSKKKRRPQALLIEDLIEDAYKAEYRKKV